MLAKFLHGICKKEIKQILRLKNLYIYSRNASQFLDKYFFRHHQCLFVYSIFIFGAPFYLLGMKANLRQKGSSVI